MSPATRAALAFCVLAGLLCACPGINPAGDGGTGGGGGGTGGGGSGGAGGGDGGIPSNDLCGPQAPCDGGLCTLMDLGGGVRGRRCVNGGCDVVGQDCDGGLKCDYRDGGRACVADGTLAEGDACASNGDACRAGLACAVVPVLDGGSEARCARYCRGDPDCQGPQQCYVSVVQAGTSELPQICANPPPGCDMLVQDCGVPGEACYPNGSSQACFAEGAVAPPGACVYSNDCVEGATCVNTAGGATCRWLCRSPAGAPACDGGACVRLTGFANVGVCL